MSIDYAKRMKEEGEFYIDKTNSETGNVVRWTSNDRIPFDDMLKHFVTLGYITEQERSNSNDQREVETDAFLAEYREQMKNHVPDEEEMFEMRAAFGPGETVVNVITGRRTKL